MRTDVLYAMSDEVIPENVCQLIAAHVDSVIALEVLLLLYREPQREWSSSEVAGELRVEVPWTQARLKHLKEAGLICEVSGQTHRYRYYPASMDLNTAVAALARIYIERPLAVICFIYSRPSSASYFADAFRLPGWSL